MEHYRIYPPMEDGVESQLALELPWEGGGRETTDFDTALQFARSANKNNGEREGLHRLVRVNPANRREEVIDLDSGMVSANCSVVKSVAGVTDPAKLDSGEHPERTMAKEEIDREQVRQEEASAEEADQELARQQDEASR